VLRNNFLVEEQPKAHVVTVADHAVEVENPEKEEMLEREDYVQSITNQLIQNAL
jgi:ferric-dicitrate binding protein FerR (iron transport regulator)